jgi:hypothetical protein
MRWDRIAGVGFSRRSIEVETNDQGHYRVMYYGFGSGHQRFEVVPERSMMLEVVKATFGTLASSMIAEACRLWDADRLPVGAERSAATGTDATAGAGACPL